MSDKQLTNPPLLEAFLELRWELKEVAPDNFTDEGFDLAHIRLASQVKDMFPFVEALPTAQVPHFASPYIPKYRYRVGENMWPLLQLGAGIATLNFSQPYHWSDFLDKTNLLLEWLVAAYNYQLPPLTRIQLRYVNSEPFNYMDENIGLFLESNLNTIVKPPVEIAHMNTQRTFQCLLEYQLDNPKGIGAVRINTGIVTKADTEVPSIIWELIIQSGHQDTPQLEVGQHSHIIRWLEEAHVVIEEWFFTFIQGQLLRKYE